MPPGPGLFFMCGGAWLGAGGRPRGFGLMRRTSGIASGMTTPDICDIHYCISCQPQP